jgi:hypothetical protein
MPLTPLTRSARRRRAVSCCSGGTAAFALPLGSISLPDLPAAGCCHPYCLCLHLASPAAGSKPAAVPKPRKPAQQKQLSTKAAARAAAAPAAGDEAAAAAPGASTEDQDPGAAT